MLNILLILGSNYATLFDIFCCSLFFMKLRTSIFCWEILTSAPTCWFCTGVPIDKVAQLSQETRNYVGCKLLELTIKELFVFRFMQACVGSHSIC